MSVSFQVAVAKSYELDSVNREAMHDAKATRGSMEADSYNKRVNGQLSDMRRHEDLKDRVDKIALEKTATRKEGAVTGTRGPKIVTHACSKLKEGHAKKQLWGPLDMY
ncbi:unnamed protein product [Amoebophrya sp. A25]|nr:unnamed protein product [Amoebophrya sp. A25]|eukprot:GSA25T00006700001.1